MTTTTSAPPSIRRSLLVEGWRFICHSYAVINQWQLLALARRPLLDLRVRDVPLWENWPQVENLFDPARNQILRDLPVAPADYRADATLRVAFPLNFAPVPAGRVLIFGTSEFRVVPRTMLIGVENVTDLAARDDFVVITPSQWAAAGFRKLDLREDQIAVIPLGVATSLFRPDAEMRATIRTDLGLRGFVFLNAGAMTTNKGIDLLLAAFAAIAEKIPDVQLVLKGVDRVYRSDGRVAEYLKRLSAHQFSRLQDRLIYIGNAATMEQMATLYQAADAYVSPYRAEGFNLPVLEAASCGLPVICTRGGATDEFVTDDFARRVEARMKHQDGAGEAGEYLEPELDDLIASMLQAIEDREWHERARIAGPAHAAGNFTWDLAAARLLSTAALV